MPVVKCYVCQEAGGDSVAGRQQPDKAPVPQHLNEAAAGPLRILRFREESSLGTRQVQGQMKKSRQCESSARCSEPTTYFREKSNISPNPMGKGCPSGKSRWDSTNPASHTFPGFMELGCKVIQLCAIRAAFGCRQMNL